MTTIPSFGDFLDSNPFKAFLADSKTARHIYENILCTNEMQRKLVEMSDKGKPAILASGSAVEDYYFAHKGECDLRLEDDAVRKAIGSMNRAALEPLSYVPTDKRASLKKGICKTFKSGRVFVKLIRKVTSVPRNAA